MIVRRWQTLPPLLIPMNECLLLALETPNLPARCRPATQLHTLNVLLRRTPTGKQAVANPPSAVIG